MKLYGAIDLHSTNSVVVVIDEQDRVVYQKRLPNDLALILKELSVYQSELEGIVVESTYNWYWLVDGLMEEGYKLHLANTAAIQQYEGTLLRHEELEEKITVLVREKEEIQVRIVDLQGKKRLAFLEAFERVREALDKVSPP